MKTLVAVLVGALAVACASSGAASGGRGNDDRVEGVFEFFASIPSSQPGATIRVKGTLSAFDDSLWIQTGPECVEVKPSARYRTPSTDRVVTVYCSGASMTFEREKPQSARWFSRVPVTKQRNVCAEYRPRLPNENSPRCLRWKSETYSVYEQRTGTVQVKRIS